MSPAQRALPVSNIAGAMRTVPREIQMRQIAHFYRADLQYGAGTAARLEIKLAELPGIGQKSRAA